MRLPEAPPYHPRRQLFLTRGLFDDAFKPLTMVQAHGLGLVVGFAFDPNFRAYIEGLNVMFLNAVFRGPARARPPVLQ